MLWFVNLYFEIIPVFVVSDGSDAIKRFENHLQLSRVVVIWLMILSALMADSSDAIANEMVKILNERLFWISVEKLWRKLGQHLLWNK